MTGEAKPASIARSMLRWAPALILAAVCACGCKKDDMADEPKVLPYDHTALFANGTEARPVPAGAVSRDPRNTPGMPYAMQWAPGPQGASDVPRSSTIPMPVTPELIARGQQRFNIYCAPCHGRLGDGNGMVVQRGMIRPPSFHNDRLSDPKRTPDSHFYDVISNGYGAMFSYSERVAPNDRWAIAAYVRVLQQSVKQAHQQKKISDQEYTALKGMRP